MNKNRRYLNFLKEIKKTLEPLYGEKLEGERLELIAERLIRFACVCHNFHSKRQGKKPIYNP